MARLRWNFTCRRWWASPSLAISIVALFACMQALWWRDGLLQRREQMITRAHEMSHRVKAMRPPASMSPSPALEQVFLEMRYPWNAMLASLRHASKPSLDLLTLEPDAGAFRRMHISGTAEQTQDVFNLVQALQDDRSWSSVQLVSETKNDDATMLRASNSVIPRLPGLRTRSVSFSLVAEWELP